MKLQHNEWGDDDLPFAKCERSSKLSRPWLIWALFVALAVFALWYWPTLGAG